MRLVGTVKTVMLKEKGGTFLLGTNLFFVL